MMARDILSIQAAGVGIEREFSIARNFNGDNTRYSPAVLGALMVCNHAQSEDINEAKRDYYIRLREEEIGEEDLAAEQEQDAKATEQVLTGLTTIYVSDDDEGGDSDAEGEDEVQATEHSRRRPLQKNKKRARADTCTVAKTSKGGARAKR
jgi:hypothetical protein